MDLLNLICLVIGFINNAVKASQKMSPLDVLQTSMIFMENEKYNAVEDLFLFWKETSIKGQSLYNAHGQMDFWRLWREYQEAKVIRREVQLEKEKSQYRGQPKEFGEKSITEVLPQFLQKEGSQKVYANWLLSYDALNFENIKKQITDIELQLIEHFDKCQTAKQYLSFGKDNGLAVFYYDVLNELGLINIPTQEKISIINAELKSLYDLINEHFAVFRSGFNSYTVKYMAACKEGNPSVLKNAANPLYNYAEAKAKQKAFAISLMKLDREILISKIKAYNKSF